MRKILYVLLCAVLIIGGLLGCTSGNKNDIEDTIKPAQTADIISTESASADKAVEDENNETNNSYPTGKIISVSAGGNHTMALNDKGELWVWGDNFFGQVGNGKVSTYLEPVYEAVEGEEYAELVDGRIRDIDNDVYTPKYIMDNVINIYAREDSCFAITTDGKLYAWGKNECGQLFDGTTENKSTPAYIMDDVRYVDSSNNQTTIIIKTDNTLWIAGRHLGWTWDCYEIPTLLHENVKKAAFDGNDPTGLVIWTVDNKLIVYKYYEEVIEEHYVHENWMFEELNHAYDVVDISCVNQQVYILDTNGDVYGWGANGYEGYLGAKGEVFWVEAPVFIASDIKKIFHGRFFIKNDGTLLTWGTVVTTEDHRGVNGEYGGGITGELITYGKTPVSILNNAVMADGRKFHYVALDSDGNVYTWGQNFYGQLGNGSSVNQTMPMMINFP